MAQLHYAFLSCQGKQCYRGWWGLGVAGMKCPALGDDFQFIHSNHSNPILLCQYSLQLWGWGPVLFKESETDILSESSGRDLSSWHRKSSFPSNCSLNQTLWHEATCCLCICLVAEGANHQQAEDDRAERKVLVPWCELWASAPNLEPPTPSLTLWANWRRPLCLRFLWVKNCATCWWMNPKWYRGFDGKSKRTLPMIHRALRSTFQWLSWRRERRTSGKVLNPRSEVHLGAISTDRKSVV